jgi:hypothetical protein
MYEQPAVPVRSAGKFYLKFAVGFFAATLVGGVAVVGYGQVRESWDRAS